MCCRERMDEFFKRTNDGRGNWFCSTRNTDQEWKIPNGKTRVATSGKTRKRCCSSQSGLENEYRTAMCSSVLHYQSSCWIYIQIIQNLTLEKDFLWIVSCLYTVETLMPKVGNIKWIFLRSPLFLKITLFLQMLKM